MKTILALAALAATALVIVPTAAQEPVSADRTVAVRFADLDLASPAGVSALDRRIAAAIRIACGTASDADLHGKNQVQQCRTDKLAGVAAQRDQAIALAQRSSSVQLAAQ